MFGDGGVYYTNRAEVKIYAGGGEGDVGFLRAVRDAVADRLGVVGNIVRVGGGELALVFENEGAVRLLESIRPWLHHPLKLLRAELILARKRGVAGVGRLSYGVFRRLYEQTRYGEGDPKRGGAVLVMANALPQYLLAWLISYRGRDCTLWREVLSLCLSSKLCREMHDKLHSGTESNHACS